MGERAAARAVDAGAATRAATSAAVDLDAERAAAVLPLVAKLLGLDERETPP